MVKRPKITRRKAIYLGGATLATTALMGSFRQPKSLKANAARKGLLYGAAGAYSKLSENKEFAQRFVEECAILTPENDLKWHKIHPKPDQYDFSQGDWLAEFAKQHQLKMRGHTLVWHQSTPKWLKETANPQNAESILRDHIMTVAGHYQGLPYDYEKRDRRIAEVYEMYLSTVLEEPNVIGVLTWGLSDRYTWLSKHRPRKDKAPVRPLPLDREFKPKLAWKSIAKSLASSP